MLKFIARCTKVKVTPLLSPLLPQATPAAVSRKFHMKECGLHAENCLIKVSAAFMYNMIRCSLIYNAVCYLKGKKRAIKGYMGAEGEMEIA